MGQVESCFGLFGDSVWVGARLVHGLRQTYTGSGIILTHPMVLLGDETLVEAHLGLFGDSANLDAR